MQSVSILYKAQLSWLHKQVNVQGGPAAQVAEHWEKELIYWDKAQSHNFNI